ncbi:hypothetical protein PBI_CANTARE_89 [Brevibacterium phage Cantare]|uniref:Uncharacterized protein n=1 Tax=Brevibacterium phage Cantare TaxID=2338395 RepID=A0A3G3LYV1_9CAUD|nr:hypothetical protein PQD70_gp089 [Brevibacterium phage Cantare]AYQ99309.1 hypothetical protein PBI_CANTARE_89 [Brevibacterium phage Cantare]
MNFYPKYPPKVDTAEDDNEYVLRTERQLQRYIFGNGFAGNDLNTPTSQEYERDPSAVPIDGFIDMVNLSHNVVSMIAREQLVILNRIMANHRDGMDSEIVGAFERELAKLSQYAKEEHNGLS